MFKAQDIMITDVITVRADTPIYEAMKILVENSISGLPVVDKNMVLVGIITEKDMLCLLVEGDIERRQTVGDYMNKKVVCFRSDDDILSICDFFTKSSFRRFPIIKDGKMAGIVSRRDIIKLILKLRPTKEK